MAGQGVLQEKDEDQVRKPWLSWVEVTSGVTWYRTPTMGPSSGSRAIHWWRQVGSAGREHGVPAEGRSGCDMSSDRVL